MARKLFKFTPARPLSFAEYDLVQLQWEEGTRGTDLEGSKLLIIEAGMVDPLSETAVLEEAARVLEKRGKLVYARELRQLAGA